MERFPYIDISGTEYELGLQIGKIFSEDIRVSEDLAREQMRNACIRSDFEVVRSKLEESFPEQLEHVYGRADGAGVDRELYLLFLCYELWEEREQEHCSDIIVKQKGQILMGHNEDGPYTKRNSAFIKYNPGSGFFFDYATPDALPGASFGFNNHGLVYSMNYMYIENMRRTAIPVWFLVRQIVECSSIEEIGEKLSGFDIASGFHLNIFIQGKAYSIEGRFDRAEIGEIDGVFVHTNHYLNESFDTGYTSPDSNTLFRLAKIKSLLKGKSMSKGYLTMEDLEETLSYRAESYYNSILSEEDMKRNITACTVLFDSSTNRITLINRLEKKRHEFTLP